MSKHLSRKQMKRDEFGEAFARAFDWIREHGRMLAAAGGAVLVLALAVEGFVLWRASHETRAQDLLARALRLQNAPVTESDPHPDDEDSPSFASADARDAAVRSTLQRLVDEHGSTEPGAVAGVYLGQLALADGDRARARQLWQQFLEGHQGSALAASVELNLLSLDREENRLEAAVESLQAELDSTEADLPADVALFQLGKALGELGRQEEARAAFQRLVDEHPASPFVTEAQRELDAQAS